ncbi:MAG TPA: ABC transporter substrate-binding protein [Solirubrobacteraceae bacterium]|jgi:NitT/TauT family transport system substrate-binding protein/putative hydroxymethylpyrimidine transport system substrate-binding protein|nr:ABC transporter substrate-binding protein [Solirubrobacteraceae bacterium]
MRRPVLALLAAASIALAVSGCGSGASSRGLRRATLILDFVPNAVHVGIYDALGTGLYRRRGIDLRVIPPSSTSDTLRLIDAGKADFGIADGIDVAQQIASGQDAVAVMAIVQRPLGAVIALAHEHLRSAAALQGRTVGITGVPSDLAVLDTEVAHAGGNPAKVHVVTIGFDGTTYLEAGKIDAFTGYWADDGVQVALAGDPVQDFRLEQNGGPAYPGLIVFTTRREIARDPTLVRAFVAATVQGYEQTLRDPGAALDQLLRQNPTIERRLAAASLRDYLPLFAEGGAVGELHPAALRALSSWLYAHHLIKAPIVPSRFGTNAFLP